MKSRTRTEENGIVHLGFQLAPLVDVVFVIMLFFLVMAGSMKAERSLSMQLPDGRALPDSQPTEVDIRVEAGGAILLNDAAMDSVTSGGQPRLAETLGRLQVEASRRGARVLVTVQAEADAQYARVIDAMNAVSLAGINNVTFTVGSDD